MLLKTKVHDASRFDWVEKSPGCFASDLAPLREGGPFGRIYDDACDIGFCLVNPGTGGETWWYISETHKDGEGDITHWTLKAAPETVRKFPKLAAYTLTVFND